MLTLIRLTSERPCQDWGGAPEAPPCYLGSGANFCSKIMFPQRLASIPTHLAPFWKFFSKITKKISDYRKSIKKWLNMSNISKFCNFWAISTCNTSKESIFHIEFNFKQKKYDLFQEKLKNQFFSLFSKSMVTSCLQMHVSQICAKKFKNWICLCFGNVLKLKVTKGELIISIHLEMAVG